MCWGVRVQRTAGPWLLGWAPTVGGAIRTQTHVLLLLKTSTQWRQHWRGQRSRPHAPQGVGNDASAVATLVLQGLLEQQGVQVWLLQLQDRHERVLLRLRRLVGLLKLGKQRSTLRVVALLVVMLFLLLRKHVVLARLLVLLWICQGLLRDKLL